jgi:two-component sensor histidine kinase
MVSDILDISKLQTARLELQVTDVHFSRFLTDLVAWFRDQAREKGLTFHYEPDPHLPTGILADAKRLRQILHHLLSNAVKFTQHGSITFQVNSTAATDTPEVHHFEFIVADTGAGMTETTLSQLFKPFEQASDWLHKSAGAGLGLSLAKQLVELMGGQIHIHSELGIGTRATVQLDFIKSQEWHDSSAEDTVEIAPEILPATAEPVEIATSLMKGPTAAQAAELCNLARMGDFFEILALIERLEQADPELHPFVTQVQQWAENFRDEPIIQLAQQFTES